MPIANHSWPTKSVHTVSRADQPVRGRRLLLVGVAVVTAAFSYLLTTLTRPRLPAARSVEAALEARNARRYGILREVLAAPLHESLGTQLSSGRTARLKADNKGEGQPSRKVQPNHGAKVPASPRGADGAHFSQGDAAYEALYGNATRYAQAAHQPLVAGAAAGVSKDARPVRGLLLQARLATEAASLPQDGTVIAILAAPAQLGSIKLAAGTQVHGTVRGAQGGPSPRLFVEFRFALTSDGTNHPLSAVAHDRQGRTGLPGRLSGSDAGHFGDMGRAAAAGAGRAVGQTLAGQLGGVLGAGLQGAASTSPGVYTGYGSVRMEVVVVPRGTPFKIYVQEYFVDSG